MKTALVTGAAGFIGSHILKRLIKQDCDDIMVCAIDNLSGGTTLNLPGWGGNAEPLAYDFVVGDINDKAFIDNLFAEYKFDYVYHFAAYAAEGLSHFIRRFNYQNNVIGSINLINAAVNYGTKHFTFASSIAVYGEQIPPYTEFATNPQPIDPYGIAKYAVELDLAAAFRQFGLNYTIFRPHNVYGPNQNIGDKYRNVIGIFFNQMLQGKPVTIFGDGSQQRAFTYIDDIVEPMVTAAFIATLLNDTKPSVYNIGSGAFYTVLELAQMVAKALGKPDYRIEHVEARDEVHTAFADHSLLHQHFGPQRSTPLAEGLQRMADYGLRRGPRPTHEFENIEILKGLPKSWTGK